MFTVGAGKLRFLQSHVQFASIHHLVMMLLTSAKYISDIYFCKGVSFIFCKIQRRALFYAQNQKDGGGVILLYSR